MSTQYESDMTDYEFDPEGRTKNIWIERTLGREMFYEGAQPREDAKSLREKLDGPPRCFVLRRPQPASVYGGVEFWLQVGVRTDGSLIGVPFYSGVPVQKWTYKDDKGNIRIGVKYPPKDDALGEFVKKHYNLIVPKVYKGKTELWSDGSPKRNYDMIFCVEAYEVLFEFSEIDDPKRPGKKKKVYVKGEDGKAKFSINPKPWILKMRRPWWVQLKNRVLVPKEEEEVAAPVTEAPDGSKPAPVTKKWSGKLPTTDLSQVLLMFWARTGPDPAKGEANVEYSVQFSETMTINSKAIVPVEELPSRPDGNVDWHKIYPPLTNDKALDIVSKSEEEMGGGDEHGEAPPPSHEDTPPPPGDDDIPF